MTAGATQVGGPAGVAVTLVDSPGAQGELWQAGVLGVVETHVDKSPVVRSILHPLEQ